MPRGEHFYTCLACGSREICGDCIPMNCPKCERKIREFHPGEQCPCWDCKKQANEQAIHDKLCALVIELQAENADLKRRLAEATGQPV